VPRRNAKGRFVKSKRKARKGKKRHKRRAKRLFGIF
jgi:hypothetical protein